MKVFKFVLLLVLGIFIYFHKLERVPNGFYIDEAYPAYNAYSILKTGKDEYGKAFPIVFRFYGSYNPPLYTYLTVFPVWIWGLNIFSARFISALSGVAFFIPVYLFLRDLKVIKNKITPFIGSFLAIAPPWIVFYGRIGYEVSLALTIFSFGAYFFWKGLKKPKNLIWGTLLLSLSTYAAYAQRFIVPILLIGFICLFRKILLSKKHKVFLIKSLGLSLLTQIPNLYLLFTPAFFPKINLLAQESMLSQIGKLNLYFPYFISLPLAWFREFFSQFVTYFSPRSLFFLPDPDLQRSIPTISVFYFWMTIPYFLGIYALWKNRGRNAVKYLFILLITCAIPAAFTRDPFSTHRALPLAFPWIITIALGVDTVISRFSKFIWQPTLIFLIFSSFLLFWRGYFVFLPKERAKVWQYGYEELAQEIQKRPGDKFVIDQARLKPSYINLLFFLKYPPEIFQKEVDQSVKNQYYKKTEFNKTYKFGNIETRNIDWQTDVYQDQILVGDEYAISLKQAKEHFLTKIFEIRDPMGQIIFVGYQTNAVKKSEKTD